MTNFLSSRLVYIQCLTVKFPIGPSAGVRNEEVGKVRKADLNRHRIRLPRDTAGNGQDIYSQLIFTQVTLCDLLLFLDYFV